MTKVLDNSMNVHENRIASTPPAFDFTFKKHKIKNKSFWCYCVGTKAGSVQVVPLEYKKGKTNQKDDLALFPVEANSTLNDYNIKILKETFILSQEEVLPGEEVFFLGYSLGLSTINDITPFVRKGIVSRKVPKEKKLIIDGYSIGGSSGSPVFLRPSLFSPNGVYKPEKLGRPPYLIGMILGHKSHPENKYENTNLAVALEAEIIKKYANEHTF